MVSALDSLGDYFDQIVTNLGSMLAKMKLLPVVGIWGIVTQPLKILKETVRKLQIETPGARRVSRVVWVRNAEKIGVETP